MMRLSEAARSVQGHVVGAAPTFLGVSTDTRTTTQGDLFVALRGERYDGHAFLPDAAAAGAVAAMVDRAPAQTALPLLLVADTRDALGELARDWRQHFSLPLIAVVGSNGKTTVKEMIGAILRAHAGAAVLATQGNLNNDIGVPLTILRLRANHRLAVVEIGMNHPGETARLAEIASPYIGLINNAQREHLEFMCDVDQVATEHASLIDAVPDNGTIVINGDDAYAQQWMRDAGLRKVWRFGFDPSFDVHGASAPTADGIELELSTPVGAARARIAIRGRHHARNAMAACAATLAAGVPLGAVVAGLETFRPAHGRSQVKRGYNGCTVIDDSYNANPDSMRAAIDVLAEAASPRLLVLGDMGEVGDRGSEFHREIGIYAKLKSVDALFAVGTASRDTTEAFGAGAKHFEDVESLLAALLPRLTGRATVLVKASRFMRLERLVAALCVMPPSGSASA